MLNVKKSFLQSVKILLVILQSLIYENDYILEQIFKYFNFHYLKQVLNNTVFLFNSKKIQTVWIEMKFT